MLKIPDSIKKIGEEADQIYEERKVTEVTPILIRNENGTIKKLRANLVTMLRTDPASQKLQFNEFTYEIEKDKEPINDRFVNSKLLEIERKFHMKFSKDDMFIALEEIAYHQKYHPVKEMIESKAWDQVPRAETLFIDYIGAEDNEYTRAIAKKWLTGAVKRIYEAGCKFEIVPVLQGAQGLGKSTLASKLGAEYFTDSLKGLGRSKDDYQLLLGTWILELGELSSMKSTDNDTMKNFLSASFDKLRLPYGHIMQKFKRTVAFIGTTNPEQYLTDFTGNRRFFPIHSKGKPRKSVFELDEATIQQIWAEAFTFYKNGVKPFIDERDPLDLVVATIAEEYRKQATEYSTAMTDIQDYLEMKVPEDWYQLNTWQKRNYFRDYQEGKTEGEEKLSKTSVKEIMQVVMKVENNDHNEKSVSKKVKMFMDNAEGWEAKPIKMNNKTVRGYSRV